MLTLIITSSRSKIQEVLHALVKKQYDDLVAHASESLEQRLRLFIDNNEENQDWRLAGALLLKSLSKHTMEQSDISEQEHVLGWINEVRRSYIDGRLPEFYAPSLVTDVRLNDSKLFPLPPMFQKSIEEPDIKDIGVTSKGSTRTMVLIVVEELQMGYNVGVLLIGNDDKEANWRFHGVACLSKYEEKLIAEGWRPIQGQNELSTIISTISVVSNTTQYNTGRLDQEDDDSDDDYWGQYGDSDGGNDDISDSSPTEIVSSPSSSSSSSTTLSLSAYQYPTGAAVKESIEPVVTIDKAIPNESAGKFIRASSCHWGGIDEIDEDDDDAYWSKYGDQDDESEQASRQQQGQGQMEEPDQEFELCANVIDQETIQAKDNYTLRAERQKIDQPVPTIHQQKSKGALPNSDTVSSSLNTLVTAPIPEPGQVDPTALTLRLMNLITHHTNPTGYGQGQRGNIDYSYYYDGDSDNDREGNEGSDITDGIKNQDGFLIRLDSRFQKFHSCAVTPPHYSEHLSHQTFDNIDSEECTIKSAIHVPDISIHSVMAGLHAESHSCQS
ncbi:hypothetical protein FBU30_001775 [Linnemannia zychae]|nr:hypothetical protein FBU30_001775 [Linnemannia zychae]